MLTCSLMMWKDGVIYNIFPTLRGTRFHSGSFFSLRERILVLELVTVTWIIALPLNSKGISLNLEYILSFLIYKLGITIPISWNCWEVRFDNVVYKNTLYPKSTIVVVVYSFCLNYFWVPNWDIVCFCSAELMRNVGLWKQRGRKWCL